MFPPHDILAVAVVQGGNFRSWQLFGYQLLYANGEVNTIW